MRDILNRKKSFGHFHMGLQLEIQIRQDRVSQSHSVPLRPFLLIAVVGSSLTNELANSRRIDLAPTTGGAGISARDNRQSAGQSQKGAAKSFDGVAHVLPDAVAVLHGAWHD